MNNKIFLAYLEKENSSKKKPEHFHILAFENIEAGTNNIFERPSTCKFYNTTYLIHICVTFCRRNKLFHQ